MKQDEEESKETGKKPEAKKKGKKGSKGNAKAEEPEADPDTAKRIHEMATLKSGSSATEEQFLAFRIIWPNPKSINELPRPIGGGDKLGVFQAIRKYQLQVEVDVPEQPMEDGSLVQSQNIWLDPADDFAQAAASDASHETASKSPSVPNSAANPSTVASVSTRTAACDQTWRVWEPTRDEQIVNQALITFLDAITMNIPDVKCGWSMARVAFTRNFKNASMEARTDGYLGLADNEKESCNKERAFAIIETKATSEQKRKWPLRSGSLSHKIDTKSL
ncbi:hypothetical protein DTO164E3_8821 [Paecilomyces variotii]|nr:hypothetical protein DTO164E3_8821 [Paecilomyces variotii]